MNISKILLLLLLVVSCGTQNQYNNVAILDNGLGERMYYPHVYIRSCEINDSLSVVSFVDKHNHCYLVCGKVIMVETIVNNPNKYYRQRYYYSKNHTYRPIIIQKHHCKTYRNNKAINIRYGSE